MTEIAAPLQILMVDDDEKDRSRVRRRLKSSSFKMSGLSGFDERLRARAKGKDVVYLDVLVDGKTHAAGPAARDLRAERPSRAVLGLTNHPADGETLRANFLLEKKEVVLKRLPWFTLAAALHDKGMFVLDQVVQRFGNNDSVDPRAPIDVEAVLMEEVRRYYEVLKLAEREPGKDPVLAEWSADLVAGLRPIYEGHLCTTADLFRLHEPIIHSVSSIQESLAAAPGVTVHPALSEELDDLSTRLQAIAQSETAPVVRKFTHIWFPRRCTLGEHVELTLCIKDDGTIGAVDLPISGDHVDLMVTLAGDGFDIKTAAKWLQVPRKGESQPVTFDVVPRATGDQYLHLHFYHDAAPVGLLIVHSSVQRSLEGEPGLKSAKGESARGRSERGLSR